MRRNWRAIAVGALFCFRLSGAGEAPAVSEAKDLERARAVLEKLAGHHRAAGTVRIKFKSRATGPDGEFSPYWKGLLLAADSGKFRLEQNQGVMVSDGKTLRQFVPENRQLILRPAPAAPPSGAVGAALPHWLEAKPLHALRTREGLRVTLDPAGAGLDSLWVSVDADKDALRMVETMDAAGNRVEYRITSLRFGVSVRAKDFTFDAPKGVELVDMR